MWYGSESVPDKKRGGINNSVASYRVVYSLNFLIAPTTPTRPNTRNSMVAGSGTGEKVLHSTTENDPPGVKAALSKGPFAK